MKYCHGTDAKFKDLLWVWTNRIFISFFTITIVILICFSCYFGFTEEPLYVVLFPWVMIVGVFFGILEFVWSNGRYRINMTGITVSTLLKKRTIPWNEIQEIGIYPVISVGHTIRDYILIFSSKKYENLYSMLTLTRCWVASDEILAIRYTDERAREFENYIKKELTKHTRDKISGKFI